MAQPYIELGRDALALIADRFQPTVTGEVRELSLPMHLVRRGSCGASLPTVAAQSALQLPKLSEPRFVISANVRSEVHKRVDAPARRSAFQLPAGSPPAIGKPDPN